MSNISRQEPIFINGLGLSGYCSFGSKMQTLAPFRKLNIFIGANNSGKSNILNFIHVRYKAYFNGLGNASQKHGGLPIGERYNRTEDCNLKIQFFFPRNHRHFGSLVQNPNTTRVTIPIEKILDALTYKDDEELVTFEYEWNKSSNDLILSSESINKIIEAKPLTDDNWTKAAPGFVNYQGPHNLNSIVRAVGSKISPCSSSGFSTGIHIIPHIRKISLGKDATVDRTNWSGDGIIHDLARLQNPGGREVSSDTLRSNREKFERINNFVRSITGLPNARLEVNYDRDTILLDTGQTVQPLENLGTGIHEVILLVVATATSDNCIFCIEEPELHIHPNLQKRLVEYLIDSTNNQYFISTHSASMIDSDDAAIFTVVYTEEIGSQVAAVASPRDRLEICLELGYRASDLLQANCIVWVEGPSDALYLRKWISDTDPEIKTGVHYTIMFYGGVLRSYLHALEQEDYGNASELSEEASETDLTALRRFISLLHINRNVIMLADSDQKSSTDEIDVVKKRINDEIEQMGGLHLLTVGKTIENYVKVEIFDQARKQVHPRSEFSPVKTIYDDITKKKSGKSIDKVGVAIKVCTHANSFRDDLELINSIQSICCKIREFNRMAQKVDLKDVLPVAQND